MRSSSDSLSKVGSTAANDLHLRVLWRPKRTYPTPFPDQEALTQGPFSGRDLAVDTEWHPEARTARPRNQARTDRSIADQTRPMISGRNAPIRA